MVIEFYPSNKSITVAKTMELLNGHLPVTVITQYCLCLHVCTCCVLQVLFSMSLYHFVTLKELIIAGHKYESWAIMVGWVIVLSSVICVPAYAVYKLVICEGTLWQVRSNNPFYII